VTDPAGDPVVTTALVTTSDADWASFQNNDPDYYMAVACREVRKFCGWHIFPNLQLTVKNLPIGNKGLITLPSMLVTDVANVMIQHAGGEDGHVLDPAAYDWFDYGAIEPVGSAAWSGYGGYYYGPENWSFLPTYQYGLATVTFNSGHATCPQDVKQVVFELTTTTMEINAGNVKEVQTPGYRMQPSQNFGATLNKDQKDRLANYQLPAVA
jgi:hypothetical protein